MLSTNKIYSGNSYLYFLLSFFYNTIMNKFHQLLRELTLNSGLETLFINHPKGFVEELFFMR